MHNSSLNFDELKVKANEFVTKVEQIELQQKANEISRQKITESIEELKEKLKSDNEALNIANNAVRILTSVSQATVYKAYSFLEESLNSSLARMFENTKRQIKLHEYTRGDRYPQLEIELIVAGGIKRSLEADSGHGLAQIVSIMAILCLIARTESRRLLVMDEIASGLSAHNREILAEVLWQFTEIGFQFVVNEHGFVPKGSRVYHLEMVGDVSHIKDTYIEEKGVYLNGNPVDVNKEDL